MEKNKVKTIDGCPVKAMIQDAMNDSARFRALANMIPVLLDGVTFRAWLMVLGKEPGEDGSGYGDRLTALRSIMDEEMK